MGLLAGVDVGGTFTDVVVRGQDGHVVGAGKVPTTPSDHAEGVVDGLVALGVNPSDVDVVVHGTTVATNALIERKGAPAAFLATHGFRDVIELRNRHRPQMYGLTGTFEPIIPRNQRFNIRERVSAKGDVVTPLERRDVEDAVERAVSAGAKAIAIGFLHSYANASHELEAESIVRALAPDLYVCSSHAVSGEIREFERFSTAAANATLMPLVSRYLESLEHRLQAAGFTGQLLIVQSNGGVASVDQAANTPVNLVLSGPAAGVTAAQTLAHVHGADELIALDMGGTSLDLAVIRNGVPRYKRQTEIRYGVPLRLQMIDITTAGAGGGSIARLDERGILNVGPESAGSYPGPACYGRGGVEATVTDANVVLHRLGSSTPLGLKSLMLDEEAARRTIKRQVADPLGLDVVEAASAITDVVAHNVVGYIRRITVDQGMDPRMMSLVSFGGAGGLHAGRVLRELELKEVILPALPGVFSAVGCTSSEFKHDYSRTVFASLDALSEQDIRDVVAEHDAVGSDVLKQEGVDQADARLELWADMQYEGQTHTILVTLDLSDLSSAAIRTAFELEYQKRFGATLSMVPTLVTLRTSVIGLRQGSRGLPPHSATSDVSEPSPVDTRDIYVDAAWRRTATYLRSDLPIGWTLEGPVLIQQDDTSLFVEPGLTVSVDERQQLILRRVG